MNAHNHWCPSGSSQRPPNVQSPTRATHSEKIFQKKGPQDQELTALSMSGHVLAQKVAIVHATMSLACYHATSSCYHVKMSDCNYSSRPLFCGFSFHSFTYLQLTVVRRPMILLLMCLRIPRVAQHYITMPTSFISFPLSHGNFIISHHHKKDEYSTVRCFKRERNHIYMTFITVYCCISFIFFLS